MNAHGLLSVLDGLGVETMRLLLAILWQSSILFVAVMGLSWLLRKRRVSIRHALWVGALLVAPFLPLLTGVAGRIGAPQAPIAVFPSVAQHAPEHIPPPIAKVETTEPSTVVSEPVSVEKLSEPKPPRHVSALAYPWALGIIFYAVCVAALLCWIIVGRLRIRHWIGAAVSIQDERVTIAFEEAKEKLGFARKLAVLESDKAPAPFTYGLFRTAVLIPKGFCGNLSDVELGAMAIHETAHTARRDPLILSIIPFVRALLFFHPLVWLACRRVSQLAEMAADEIVLRETGEPTGYARMLTRVAAGLTTRSFTTELTAGLVFSKSAFLRRVEAIFAHRNIRGLTQWAVIGIVIATVLVFGAALSFPLGEKYEEPPMDSDQPIESNFIGFTVLEVGKGDPYRFPTGNERSLGRVPTAVGEDIPIPEGTEWFIRPYRYQLDDDRCEQLALAVKMYSIPGIDLIQGDITDEGLAHLADLTELKLLNLRECKGITDSGLANLQRMGNLEALSLYNCEQITDAGLSHLRGLTSMRHLNLRRCKQITDEGLAHLRSMTKMEHLVLEECKLITGEGLAHLAGMKNLKSLDLHHCYRITNGGLAHLSRMTKMRRLILAGCYWISDEGLVHLSNMVEMQKLGLSGRRVTGSGLKHLMRMKNLVRISSKAVTGDELALLKNFSRLRVLELGNTEVADARILSHLPPLVRLEELGIFWPKVNGDGFRYLNVLPRLRELRLMYCEKLNDEALVQISDLSELEVLDLSICKSITDITPLTKLKKLTLLSLRECTGITDLTPLASLPKLMSVNLEGCSGVTDVSPLHSFLIRGGSVYAGNNERLASLLNELQADLRKESVPLAPEKPVIDLCHIGGRFIDADGNDIPQKEKIAVVIETNMSMAHKHYSSREDGTFSLWTPEGNVWLCVLAEGYAPAVFGPIRIGAGEDLSDLTVQLNRGLDAVMQFTSHTGEKPAAGAVDVVAMIKADGSYNIMLPAFRIGRFEIDLDGRVTTPNSPNLVLSLDVRANGFEHARMKGITLSPSEATEIMLERGFSCEFRIVDVEKSEPVKGATVRILGYMPWGKPDEPGVSGQTTGPGIPWATSDNEGRVKLNTLRDPSQWLYWFYIEAEGLERKIVGPIRAAEEIPDVELGSPIEVSGEVRVPVELLDKAEGSYSQQFDIRYGEKNASMGIGDGVELRREGNRAFFQIKNLHRGILELRVEFAGAIPAIIHEIDLLESIHDLIITPEGITESGAASHRG